MDLSSELSKLKIDKSKRPGFRREGRRAGLWIIVIGLLIGGGLGARTYWNTSKPAVVETIRPRAEAAADSATLVATGYVVAHHKIQVGSKIMGRVAWIGVEKGDRVQTDQVIVRLEDREYRAQYEQARAAHDAAQARLTELERGSRPEEIERAKADVQRAEAQLRTDEATFRRVQNLLREGVASAQSLDEAKGRYETSRATLDSLTKSYELIRQGARSEQIDNARSEASRAKAAADYAKTILDATEIRTPTAGTILERNVEQGEMVTTSFVGDRGAKSFVATLADLNDLQVELDITQNDFNRVHSDQRCTVVTDAYPDRPYECRVYEIAPEANRQKATIQVKVKFLQPDAYVKPEMNARVMFLSDEATNAKAKTKDAVWVVPRRAILDRDGAKSVMVAAGGIARLKPVTIAKEAGSDVQISAGLSGTESIIIGDALAGLKAGDPVETK